MIMGMMSIMMLDRCFRKLIMWMVDIPRSMSCRSFWATPASMSSLETTEKILDW